MRLGQLYKEAEEFRRLQKELPVLVRLSNVSKRDVFKRAGMSESHFYRRLNEQSFTADQLIKIFTAIVELQNFQTVKTQS
jgi:predicted transcriptional regulator